MRGGVRERKKERECVHACMQASASACTCTHARAGERSALPSKLAPAPAAARHARTHPSMHTPSAPPPHPMRAPPMRRPGSHRALEGHHKEGEVHDRGECKPQEADLQGISSSRGERLRG